MTSAEGTSAAEAAVIDTGTLQGGRTVQPIDHGYLGRFTLGNATLEREILELFAGQMPIYVRQLRTAADGKEWMLAAHTIKGSALAVGARPLADLAQAAERLDLSAFASVSTEHQRRRSADAVAAAADEACSYIARRFATG